MVRWDLEANSVVVGSGSCLMEAFGSGERRTDGTVGISTLRYYGVFERFSTGTISGCG